jgi:hypothetical protein
MALVNLHGVFDESGKFHDHDVTSLCGWISALPSWEEFALQWQAALARIGIDELHTAEFMGLHGQYSHLRTIWGEERDAKISAALTEFVNVIRGTVARGVGATIDSKYYRSMPDDFKRELSPSGDPHFVAFQEVLFKAIRTAQHTAKEHGLGTNVKVSLIFDQDEGQSVECMKLLNKMKKQYPEIRERVTGICFCDRRNYHPLQAADFIAYQTKKEMERRMYRPQETPSKWFTMLSARNPLDIPDGLFNARIFDAECLDELAAEVRRRKASGEPL